MTTTKSYKDKNKFYFNRFPTTAYDIRGDGNTLIVKNILKRFSFTDTAISNASNYVEWVIRDEDTPEIMADRLYGSTHYFWIVLMFNNMIDPYWEWPLKYSTLSRYIDDKYGAEFINATHHYEAIESEEPETYKLPKNTWCSATYPYKREISNITYEYEVNEAKRTIKLLDPEHMGELLKEFDKIMSSDFTLVQDRQ